MFHFINGKNCYIYILELIFFICSFHVKCVSKCSPRNVFFVVLANLVNDTNVYFIYIAFDVYRANNANICRLIFRDNLFAQNQSCNCFNSCSVLLIKSSMCEPDW